MTRPAAPTPGGPTGEGATPCSLCGPLGERLSVDADRGERLPPNYHRLVKRAATISDDDLLQCPACDAWFTLETTCDNDVSCPIHVYVLTRTPAQEAERRRAAKVEYDRKRRESFRRKVRRKHGTAWKSLPPDEKAVLDAVMEGMSEGVAHRALETRFGGVEEILARLEGRGWLTRSVNWPLSPGAHGFQEERKEGDARDYTRYFVAT